MNTRLLILGVDVLLVSAFVAIYGVITGSVELVGIGASTGIVGGVFVVYSLIPGEPSVGALLSYTSLLVNATTTVVEDLDLLTHRICAHSEAGYTLLVFSKKDCPSKPNPGMGFAGGFPYFSIPVDLFQDVEKLEDLTDHALENSLNTLLASELGLCRIIRVERRGDFYVIDVIGLSKLLAEYTKYPVDPVVLLVLTAVAKLVGESRVHLIEKEVLPGYTRLIVRVERFG
ncbi:MAG: hypothetical protein QXE77_03390 [Desulfurococcaceae archaeon]